MHTIKNNNITLTRGDSLYITINIFKNGEPYIPVEGDVIRFAMKAKYRDSDDKILILKEIPNDSLLLKIEPEDTKRLSFGKTYVYDIQLTDASGNVDTFIIGTFTITEEVY